MKFIFTVLFSLFLFSFSVFTQSKPVAKPVADLQPIKNSPAYAELLLRKTELASQVEDMLVDYTEDYPKLKESRYELGLLNRQIEKLLATNPAEASKLTLALGKLMLRKAEFETDHWILLQQYKEEHPDVKRAKRKVETFEKAVNEILQ